MSTSDKAAGKLRGHFITLEGGEGAGKSTQQKYLSQWLTENGVSVVQTREPGGSPGAEQIRQLLVTGDPGRWDAMTETLLHFAARRDHVVRTIEPALTAGDWVVSDRFTDSTMAYQGFGHALGRAPVEAIRELVLGTLAPDLTVILDLPVKEGLERARGRGPSGNGAEDRYEAMEIEFHERLRTGFRDIAERDPERCSIVDATGAAEEVAERIRQAVVARFGSFLV